MSVTRAKRKSSREKAPESAGFLARAARTVGQVAGTAAKAIGLDQPDSSEESHPASSKPTRKKAPKRLTARLQRKSQAEEAKSAAKNLFKKRSEEPAAPYRRIMGKPTANWTAKDLEYIHGLVAKHLVRES